MNTPHRFDRPLQDLLQDSRRAGVSLHITSLPGPYGIGEVGRFARSFIDKMVQMQLSVWQFLPTGPTAYGDSPYQPLSTFAGNEMLIDIDNLIDLQLLIEQHPRLDIVGDEGLAFGAQAFRPASRLSAMQINDSCKFF